MNSLEEYVSLVRRYPCCPELSKKGRQCVRDAKMTGHIDQIIDFKEDGAYNGRCRFSSYSDTSLFPKTCYDDVVYQEVPNIVMPYGVVGMNILHRDVGSIQMYRDMDSESKNQMSIAIYRLKSLGIVDNYDMTQAYVLTTLEPTTLNYIIDNTRLKMRVNKLVTVIIDNNHHDGEVISAPSCDISANRMQDLRKRYMINCSVTETRCNGIPRSHLVSVLPIFSATNLVTSRYMPSRCDKSILKMNEIKGVKCLISEALGIIKRNELLEQAPNQVKYINSRSRINDYMKLGNILIDLISSVDQLKKSGGCYQNYDLAINVLSTWLQLRVGSVDTLLRHLLNKRGTVCAGEKRPGMACARPSSCSGVACSR